MTLTQPQRDIARQTSADIALDGAIGNMAANRLTVEQIMELAERFAGAEGDWAVNLNCQKFIARRMSLRDQLEAAIRANHRDAKP